MGVEVVYVCFSASLRARAPHHTSSRQALRAPLVGNFLDERCHGRGPIDGATILLHAWHTSKPFDKVVFEGRVMLRIHAAVAAAEEDGGPNAAARLARQLVGQRPLAAWQLAPQAL